MNLGSGRAGGVGAAVPDADRPPRGGGFASGGGGACRAGLGRVGLGQAGGEGGQWLALLAILLFALVLCALPLGLLLRTAVAPRGEWAGLAAVAEALAARSVRVALWNSLDSALWSALLATAAGTGLALLVGLADLRAKPALVFLILMPMMIPPHVTAVAWIQALGPASPLLVSLGIAPEAGSNHPLYSRGGVIALLSIQHAPLAFLVVWAALRTLPREMADAARVSGAGPWRVLRRVVAPLLAPTLIAGFALAFVSALGNFGIPALLGAPGRYITLPVLIWQRMASFGPSMLPTLAVLSAVIALVAGLAAAAAMAVQRRARTALIGPPQAAMRWRLGEARIWVELGVWGLLAGVLALPIAALVGAALVPAYGMRVTAETATLDNFREVLWVQSVTLRAFGNSTLAAGAAALALAGVAVALGWFLTRPRGAARQVAGLAAGLGEMTYAVPGVVISIAFILAFLRPLPVLGVSLYGTLGLIVLAYLAAFMAVGLKPVAAAYGQLDPALDDAARVAGAGWGRRMRRIFAPLTAPAAASGAILVFLTAYNEVTVSSLLWSTGNETIGTVIFNYEDGGATTLAAAMSVVTVAATAGLMAALHVAGRRAPPGVVPWRG